MCFDFGCVYSKSDIIIVWFEDKHRNFKNSVSFLWDDFGIREVAQLYRA